MAATAVETHEYESMFYGRRVTAPPWGSSSLREASFITLEKTQSSPFSRSGSWAHTHAHTHTIWPKEPRDVGWKASILSIENFSGYSQVDANAVTMFSCFKRKVALKVFSAWKRLPVFSLAIWTSSLKVGEQYIKLFNNPPASPIQINKQNIWHFYQRQQEKTSHFMLQRSD